ncbi:unnamed protein product [Leptidea sinapis]|uniref:Dystroglycan-type cadherin-like domain-containing protein n=1 Tax=Leptidea sinapis TaxID=189913 RepID=A0A5E4QA48_9NEOP|nr:unnamed protein product [Leptidea sinapis]
MELMVRCVACAVLLLCQAVLGRHDDDFAFDNNDEFQLELTANHSEITKNGLKRLWGVPDTSAYVGHLFRMEIPKEAFTGEVSAYKVRSDNGRRLPSWLAVDTKHGLISGLPQRQDLGAHTFTVTAHGRAHGLTATDVFTIEVKKSEEKPQSKYGACVHNENRLVLVILLDASFHKIAPRQRIRALMELANFMALDGNYDGEEDPADYSGYGDDEDDEYDSPLDIGPVPDIDHKVKITPYLGSASESTNINITKPLPTNRNLDHSPVVIVPEDVTTSTEPELVHNPC